MNEVEEEQESMKILSKISQKMMMIQMTLKDSSSVRNNKNRYGGTKELREDESGDRKGFKR